jgi:hypothetical protein
VYTEVRSEKTSRQPQGLGDVVTRICGQSVNIGCKIHIGVSFPDKNIGRTDLGCTCDVLAAVSMKRYIFWDVILDYNSFVSQKTDISFALGFNSDSILESL